MKPIFTFLFLLLLTTTIFSQAIDTIKTGVTNPLAMTLMDSQIYFLAQTAPNSWDAMRFPLGVKNPNLELLADNVGGITGLFPGFVDDLDYDPMLILAETESNKITSLIPTGTFPRTPRLVRNINKPRVVAQIEGSNGLEIWTIYLRNDGFYTLRNVTTGVDYETVPGNNPAACMVVAPGRVLFFTDNESIFRFDTRASNPSIEILYDRNDIIDPAGLTVAGDRIYVSTYIPGGIYYFDQLEFGPLKQVVGQGPNNTWDRIGGLVANGQDIYFSSFSANAIFKFTDPSISTCLIPRNFRQVDVAGNGSIVVGWDRGLGFADNGYELFVSEEGKAASDGDYYEINNSNRRSFSFRVSDPNTTYIAHLVAQCDDGISDTIRTRVGVDIGVNRVYVDANASGNNDGTSWADAYTELSNALTNGVTRSRTEVWIANGTYVPNTINNRRDATFQLDYDSTYIYGGFQGNEQSFSDRATGGSTILSGDVNGNDVQNLIDLGSMQDNVHTVMTLNAGRVLIDGVTIEAGNSLTNNGAVRSSGGGIFMTNNAKNLLLRSSIIRRNVAFQGAGIFGRTYSNQDCRIIIQRCSITDNLSRYGTGLYYFTDDNGSAFVSVTNSVFSKNGAGDVSPSGDGLGYGGSSAWIRSVGQSSFLGFEFRNNTFVSNVDFGTSTVFGTAALATLGISKTNGILEGLVENCIFDKNIDKEGNSLSGVNTIFENLSSDGDLVIKNSTDPSGFSNKYPQVQVASVSPVFVDANNGDYNLAAGASDHIDKGATDADTDGELDFAGNPRIVGNQIDIGAFEFDPSGTAFYTLSVVINGQGVFNVDKTGPYVTGDTVRLTAVPNTGWQFTGWSGDVTSTDNPLVYIVSNTNLTVEANFQMAVNVDDLEAEAIQLFPNPVKDILSIDSESMPSILSVYDAFGRLLVQVEGKRQVDLSAFEAGLYLVVIEIGDGVLKIKKIVKE